MIRFALNKLKKHFHLLLLLPLHVFPVKADELDLAIIDAIFPPPSHLCYGAAASETTFTSVFSSTGGWNAANAKYEKDAFGIEMTHNDPKNVNHTWSLRIGKGGQMMSLIGPYGEANANQAHVGAAWCDLVTQIVSVDTKRNDQAPYKGYRYFIHGSGPYMRDVGMPPPFYNPKLALTCQANQCTSVNWGQQAHVPTVHRSDAIYYQRYRDCGSGIIEYDQAIYHSGRDANDVLNFFNTPWSNVRASTFGYMQISKPSGELDSPEKILGFGTQQLRNLDTTGGFTTFSQVPKNSFFDETSYDPGFCIVANKSGSGAVANVPCSTPGSQNFKLTVQEDNTVKFSAGHTSAYGYNVFYMVASNLKAPVKQGCNNPPKGGIIVTNSRTNFKFSMSHVIHWAWDGKWLYFGPSSSGITASILNNQFKKGDQLILSYSLKDYRTYIPFCTDPNRKGNQVANCPCSRKGSYRFGLTVQADNTAKLSTGKTASLGYNVIFMDANNLNAPVKEGDKKPPGGEIFITNSRTNFRFIIKHVIHWAWAGRLFYFSPSSSEINASFINEQFKKGDKLLMTIGVAPTEHDVNVLSLSFVHGTNPEFFQSGNSYYNSKSRMRYGTTNSERDGTVWTSNFRGNLNPTETYYNRKYLISGNIHDIELIAPSYVSETIEDIVQVGQMSNKGESIHLFLVNNSFGPSIGKSAVCPSVNAKHICTGSAAPKKDSRPLYYITCGNVSYLGDEQYHFSPDSNDGILKPYICKGENLSVRPAYKLLGYFVVSDCSDLRDARYKSDLCSTQLTSTTNALEAVSNQALLLGEGEMHNKNKINLLTPILAGVCFCIVLHRKFYRSANRDEYVGIPDHVA